MRETDESDEIETRMTAHLRRLLMLRQIAREFPDPMMETMMEDIGAFDEVAPIKATKADPTWIAIPGEPVAQGRPRAFLNKRTGHAGVFDPAASRNYKATAQQHFRDAWGGRPLLKGPVRIEVVAIFTLPRSRWRKTPVAKAAKTGKPDGSNLLKIIEDAANGVIWVDDSQVVDARVRKFVGGQGEPPRVEIWIYASKVDRE